MLLGSFLLLWVVMMVVLYPTAEGARYFDGFRWFPLAPYGPAPPPDQSLRP